MIAKLAPATHTKTFYVDPLIKGEFQILYSGTQIEGFREFEFGIYFAYAESGALSSVG